MATTPKLPPPIRPRTLVADLDGYSWLTSDNRYRFTPMYRQHTLGGYSRKIEGWNVHKNTAWRPGGTEAPQWVIYMQTTQTLADLRALYTTPASKMPYVVADMDDGILRTAHTRADAIAWARTHLCAERLRPVGGVRGKTCWEYEDPDEGGSVFIMRADHAHLHGFDATQQPLYPHPHEPYRHVSRPAAKDSK